MEKESFSEDYTQCYGHNKGHSEASAEGDIVVIAMLFHKWDVVGGI